jgi:outer membrane protein
MKKVIILSLMVVSALSVDAQRKRTRTATSQGNVALHMGFGINSTKEDPDGDAQTKTTGVNFTPSVGYMVVDNLELGVNFGITNAKSEDIYDQAPVLNKSNTKYTDVNFGVYAKKYFPLNNWFSLTAAADLGLSTGTYQTDDIIGSVTTTVSSETGNRSGVGGAINFGLAFTPYNAFALQANIAGLGVNSMKNDPDGTNNTMNTTNVGFNVRRQTASLDFVWYLGRGLWKK